MICYLVSSLVPMMGSRASICSQQKHLPSQIKLKWLNMTQIVCVIDSHIFWSILIHLLAKRASILVYIYIYVYWRRLRRVPPAPFFPACPFRSAAFWSPWRNVEPESGNPLEVHPETLKNRSRKLKNRCLEGVWEVLGATLGRKMSKRLSWPIWADFGQARDAQNGDKMAELGAKMAPRWRQDAPRWGLSGYLDADWGVIFGILGGLGGDLCRNAWSIKMSTTIAFWLHFRVLGGLVGSCWNYLEASWREVGLSWAILASSWDLVGSILEERWRRWAKICELGGKMGG